MVGNHVSIQDGRKKALTYEEHLFDQKLCAGLFLIWSCCAASLAIIQAKQRLYWFKLLWGRLRRTRQSAGREQRCERHFKAVGMPRHHARRLFLRSLSK